MPKGMPDKGYAMTPARKRIIDLLVSKGPIEDEDGRAVAKLMEYTGHASTNALSGVLEAMEKGGMIKRHVVGRRTYSIEAAVENLAPEDAPAPTKVRAKLLPEPEPEIPTDGVDYDLLAGVLLKKALLATRAQEESAGTQQLRRALLTAETKASEAQAEAKALRSRIAELEAIVKTLEHNNKVLASSMDKVRTSSSTQIKKLISAQELKELDQLMRALPSAKG